MLDHALGAPHEEVCGLLGGRDGDLCSYYPVRNTAGDRARRYYMDPEEQVDAMRRMRAAGESLAGIFHSHPDAPAAPSATDRELAAYPGVVYVIASLAGAAPRLEAFLYDGAGFEQLTII